MDRCVAIAISAALAAGGGALLAGCEVFPLVGGMAQNFEYQKLIEVHGASGAGTAGYRYRLTDLGRDRAGQYLDICAYVGPAPVPLVQYVQ